MIICHVRRIRVKRARILRSYTYMRSAYSLNNDKARTKTSILSKLDFDLRDIRTNIILRSQSTLLRRFSKILIRNYVIARKGRKRLKALEQFLRVRIRRRKYYRRVILKSKNYLCIIMSLLTEKKKIIIVSKYVAM